MDTATVASVPSASTSRLSSADADELVSDRELPLVSLSQHDSCPDVVGLSEQETVTSQSCSEAQKRAALFLLTFKEKYWLSQSAIDFAVGSIQSIVDSVCASAISAVETNLSSATAIAANIEDPFVSFKTNYQQSKFYRERFGLVVSTQACMQGVSLVSGKKT